MYKYSILLIVCFLSFSVFAQQDKQRKLEEQKAQIQKEIQAFRELLSKEQNKEKSVLTKVEQQTTKIKLTEKLIATTQEQERLLSQNIRNNEREINLLSEELNKLKEDYSNMVVKSYKTRSEQSRAMFLLSSENFLQAYKRIQYMKQYAAFRKMQGEEVKEKSEVLQEKTKVLMSQKAQKEKLLAETAQEKEALEKDKKEQESLIALIKKNKNKYNADIKKKQKESANIDKQIEKLKREAIAEANRKKALAAGKKPTTSNVSSTKYDLSPEEKIIAGNFKANKGKLPWPLEKGYVSSRFGVQPHPIEKHLTINNIGIDFSTEKGTDARAVFEGEVSQIQVVTPVNKMVWVRHGDYVTVYCNLDQVYVKTGQKVSLKQKLGRIHTSTTNGTTIMKFCVIQNVQTLNPQQWLTGM